MNAEKSSKREGHLEKKLVRFTLQKRVSSD